MFTALLNQNFRSKEKKTNYDEVSCIITNEFLEGTGKVRNGLGFVHEYEGELNS